jgi:hypothetical protein
MKTKYILVWPEAAQLRNSGQADNPRCALLNLQLERLGASMTLHDRTGTGDDCHYRIELPDDCDELTFFDLMLSIPEVRQNSNIPFEIDSELQGLNEEARAFQEEKYNLWRAGEAKEELKIARDLKEMGDYITEIRRQADNASAPK